MGIYSEDRTMLTIDPMAESKTMNGYDSITDIYSIMEECIMNDAVIYRGIVESEASVITLDEADGAKLAKRAETMVKIAKAIGIKYTKAVAKLKSVCAGTKAKLGSFRDGKVQKMVEKYSADFAKNKDIATSARFTVKYDKKALLCTNKELDKVAVSAAKAAKDLAKNSVNIAKSNVKEINANRHAVYKVAAVEKYAKNFCCCCDEKNQKIEGNPFSDGMTPAKLVAELQKGAAIDASLDKICAGANDALGEITKLVSNLEKTAEKSGDKITAEDLEAMHAMVAVVDGITKGVAHSITDIVRCHRQHMAECIKVYMAVAKMKAVREDAEIKYVGSEAALCEADLMAEDLHMLLDI